MYNNQRESTKIFGTDNGTFITDFELLMNKQIKVFYKNGFGEDKEEIIDLNNL